MGLKLYFGCSLTHATPEFRESIEAFKNILRQELHVEIFDFIGLENGTEADVYMHDIHTCIAGCDILITEISYPSTGLGYELGVAVEKLKKPTLGLRKSSEKVTRLLKGSAAVNSHFKILEYDNLNETVPFIRSFIAEYIQNLSLDL